MLFYSFVRPLLFSWCLVLLLRIKWNESYRREQIKMCIFHLNQLFSGSIFVIFFVYDSDFYCKHNWHSGCRLQYHYNWITHTRFMVKCHLLNGNEFIDSIIIFLAKKNFFSIFEQTDNCIHWIKRYSFIFSSWNTKKWKSDQREPKQFAQICLLSRDFMVNSQVCSEKLRIFHWAASKTAKRK